MLERERLASKKVSKTNAVTSIMGHDLPADGVHIGPSDDAPGSPTASGPTSGSRATFGDVPLTPELKLEVWDSPNSAGIVIDAVRIAKLALNHGVSGQSDGPSSYLMKSPPQPAAGFAGAGENRGVHRQVRAQARRPARRRAQEPRPRPAPRERRSAAASVVRSAVARPPLCCDRGPASASRSPR